MIYRIKNWDETFERSQGRKSKVHHWVAMPVKHDGSGFRRISIQPNAAELFAAWCLIVQVAAKCPIRGTLSDGSGNAIDAEDMAIKTGFPVSIFEAAFEFFISDKIGWLTTSESDFTTSQKKDYQPAASETQSATSETQKSSIQKPHSTVHYNTNRTAQGAVVADASFLDQNPEYAILSKCAVFSSVTQERYLNVKRNFRDRDAKTAVEDAVLCAESPDEVIKAPDKFLISKFKFAPDLDKFDFPYAYGGYKLRKNADGTWNEADEAARKKAVC